MVVSGTSTLANTLTVTGNATFSNTVVVTGTANVTQGLTANTLTVSTNTATFGTSVYHVANGNVGIGTSSPGTPLHVYGGDAKIENASAAVRTRYVAGSNQWNVEVAQSSNVFQIFNAAAGTKMLEIDSSGRIIIPNQPSFQATGSFSFGGSGIININTILFDTNSNFNTGTYRFTAPVTGKYYFWGSASFYTAPSGNYVRHGQLALVKNGSITQIIKDFTYYNNLGNNQHYAPAVQGVISMTVNDYIELNMLSWSASGSFTNFGCYFGGHLIG